LEISSKKASKRFKTTWGTWKRDIIHPIARSFEGRIALERLYTEGKRFRTRGVRDSLASEHRGCQESGGKNKRLEPEECRGAFDGDHEHG